MINVTGATVKLVEPPIKPDVAVIAVCPRATLEAKPTALMVATPTADELHVAEVVKF